MSSAINGYGMQATSPAAMGKAREQATELEGVFMNTLMKEMFSSIKTDTSSFGGGFAEETWRGMQAEQLSNQMAAAGGIGLADSILGDLVAIQEANQRATAATNKGASL